MKVKFKDGTELECIQIYLSDQKLTARTNKRKNHRYFATEVEKITSKEWEIGTKE